MCRRWQQVANSPQLLRDLDLFCESPRPAQLRAALEWVQCRAAGHVELLSLFMPQELDATQAAELLSDLGAALTACGAAGGLTDVLLQSKARLHVGNWVASQRDLRKLTLYSKQLELLGPLQILTGLQQLDLASSREQVVMGPGVSLPSALTSLVLRRKVESLLPKVGPCTRLMSRL